GVRTAATRSRAASVSTMARPRGTVSGTSRWLSSPWMRRLIVDWGIPSAAAASVRCPSSSASATSSLSPASGAPVKSGKCFIFGSYSSVHSLDGLFTEAHGETMTTHTAQLSHLPDADVVLIGGGIMSATLGSMLALLEPQWRILVLEAAEDIATESSGPWNNAGTGHSGFCELNYTPDPADGSKASTIAEQFLLSRQWWAHLVQKGLLDPDAFVHSTAHMNLVFGAEHVAYLRTRVETLRADPLFAEMEYTEDPATIAHWAPLTMEGRTDTDEPLAAAGHPRGTDIDFGALTRALTTIITSAAGELCTSHTVNGLDRTGEGWQVTGSSAVGKFSVRARTVFVGAGGFALR